MKKRDIYLLLGVVLTLVGYFFGERQTTTPQAFPISSPTPVSQIEQDAGAATLAYVTRVIDGDTIEIEGGSKIRYIGINTPETVDPGRPDGCYGQDASDKNKELVLGKQVRLEKDISETDRYGRLLRYVYVEGEMVNNELVKQGYAQVSTYPPDVKYQDLFLESQKYAKEDNLGLWGECGN